MPSFFLGENRDKFNRFLEDFPHEIYLPLNMGRSIKDNSNVASTSRNERPSHSIPLTEWLNFASEEGIIDMGIGKVRYKVPDANGDLGVVASGLGVGFTRASGSATISVPEAVNFVESLDFTVSQVNDGDGTSSYSITIDFQGADIYQQESNLSDSELPIVNTFTYISPTKVVQQYDDVWEITVPSANQLTITFPNLLPVAGTTKRIKILFN